MIRHDKDLILAERRTGDRTVVLFSYYHNAFVRLSRGSVEKLT